MVNQRVTLTLVFLSIVIFVSAKGRTPPLVHMGGSGPNLILSPLPHERLSLKDLPSYWDIRNISGVNYASPIRSQMVPLYCGSCWAFGSTSSLNDRLKLMRRNAYPDFQLAPQALLDCGTSAGTCDGGSPYAAFEYIAKNPIGDETCTPYRADDMVCDELDMCQICNDDDTGCKIVTTYPKYSVSEYGTMPSNVSSNLTMEQEMMMEIYARGPIACQMHTDKIFDHYTGGVMMNRPWKVITHIITVSGWGVETYSNGTSVPYWIVRNSFGTWWGEWGWFRIQRGVNALGIESACTWAVPTIPEPWNKM